MTNIGVRVVSRVIIHITVLTLGILTVIGSEDVSVSFESNVPDSKYWYRFVRSVAGAGSGFPAYLRLYPDFGIVCQADL